MKKRMISFFLSVCLLMGLLSGMTISASAKTPQAASDDVAMRLAAAKTAATRAASEIGVERQTVQNEAPTNADLTTAIVDIPMIDTSLLDLSGIASLAQPAADSVEAELSADRSTVMAFLIWLAQQGEYSSSGMYHYYLSTSAQGVLAVTYIPGDEVSIDMLTKASSAQTLVSLIFDVTNVYSSTFDASIYYEASSGLEIYAEANGTSRSAFSNSTSSMSLDYYDGLSSYKTSIQSLLATGVRSLLNILDFTLHNIGDNYCIKDLGFTAYKADECTTGQTVAVTGITLNKSSVSIGEGYSEYLTATVYPSNATNKTVTWSSSNSSVATVNSSGLVTGVRSGSATIYASCGNYSTSCQVTVTHTHNYKSHAGKAATCTEVGWYSYNTCTGCSYTTYQEIPATGHSWNSGSVTTEASCEKTGVKTFTCANCGSKKTETIAALGHNLTHYSSKAATCTTAGYKAYDACTRCSYTTKVEIPATGHAWGVGTVTTAPTCTEEGEKRYTCANDAAHTSTEVIPATGHTSDGNTDCEKATYCTVCGDVIKAAGAHVWNNGEVTTAATCESAGVKTFTCTVCTVTKTETIDALGHAWDAGKVTTAATCENDGVKTFTCANDAKHTYTETISALGHNEVSHEAKTETCTEIGWEAYLTCSRCDYTTYKEIAALGHDEVTHEAKAATCTEGGWNAYKTCKREGCEYSTYEAIPALGHTSDGNTDCEKATSCTVCGDVIKAAGDHFWNEGEFTTAPTCKDDGEKIFTCDVCGATKTAVVEDSHLTVAHTFTYTGENAVITGSCSVCENVVTATISAEDATYTGEAITKATVAYSETWNEDDRNLEIIYTNNVNAGEAKATIAKGDATAEVTFTIAKAAAVVTIPENLSQNVTSTDPVGKLPINDPEAKWETEYEVPLTQEEIDSGNYGESTTKWTADRPTSAGTYKVRTKLVSSTNYEASEDWTEGTLTLTKSTGYYVPIQSTVEQHKHALTHVPAKAATETEEGNIEHWYCADCGRYFTNPAASIEATKDKLTLPKLGTTEPTPETAKFNDVKDSDWFNDAINFVAEKGLMTGTSKTEFSPNANTTRAMLMTILARLAGVDTEGGATWYEKGLKWSKDNGISDGTNPELNITREQLVTMLYRYAKSPAATGELKFTDAANVSSWALDAMKWATANGIVTGMSNNELQPTGLATRAQMAAILMRYAQLNAQ